MRINKRNVYHDVDWVRGGSGCRDEGWITGRNQQDNVSGVAQAKDLIESQHPFMITRAEGSVKDSGKERETGKEAEEKVMREKKSLNGRK